MQQQYTLENYFYKRKHDEVEDVQAQTEPLAGNVTTHLSLLNV